MRRIKCEGERIGRAGDILRCGSLAYRVETDWAKWPDQMEHMTALNCCWGADGFLYVVTGKPDAPVVVFDREWEVLQDHCPGKVRKIPFRELTRKTVPCCWPTRMKSAHVIKEITTEGKEVRVFGTQGFPGTAVMILTIWRLCRSAAKVPPGPDGTKTPQAMPG